jgi:hypothetical protein
MVDTQYHRDFASLMSSFPTIEQAIFHAQRFYMGTLLEDFTFASGASNATANTYYITALYLDLRYASVPLSFLIAWCLARIDSWYYQVAHDGRAVVVAAYITVAFGAAKLSSSHLGTVLVSEGMVFVIACAGAIAVAKRVVAPPAIRRRRVLGSHLG